ncbi:helix-turn-helix transcriptional regulator [Paraburkholderia sp. Ac-20336]|uniref:helix-turn-helix transcriptional regulator n=1 Tax=Burkholderiaceae TaxID=119060 RepID=UPI0014236AC7|nr:MULTISPECIES: helix-turn-helix transcriptional regulator [Burkholderiaceae]MBN3806984.1 helix-turn-helix transcriptional regulator [Paraburkholderia sp. Ac-20336]MBN3845946.1 helix-turn-helix transcriptional regulator [Paraburkholderia sp. Ac-20342]NIF54088.1 helix-turn-helix transcriptional regulator [Burkholderia sp. Ax-1724]NIF77800.1 helix-turn-helix transcriptional regulator [Paraburkholderia sp. Cy-641]
MFSTVYFAASSALASDDTPSNVVSKILDGHLIEASHAAAQLVDTDAGHAQPSHANLQIHGDLELALGRHEEAEETHRRAQKAIRHDRDGLRIASCRNTGWLAFFRNQFNVALSCFKRIGEEKAATPRQRLDALVGATLVSFHLGCVRSACGRLAKLAELAAAHDDRRWIYVVEAIRRDLFAQHELHGAERLADHIYWRSVLTEFDIAEAPVRGSAPEGTALPLLAGRLAHLRHLLSLAEGGAIGGDELHEHLNWSRKSGLADYHRSLCLEITLAAIAGQVRPLAESMLDASGAAASQGTQHARWYLDYLYCRAKVMQQQMRTQEFSHYYGRYALASIQHVRTDNQSMSGAPADAAKADRAAPRSDDVSARLPAKYRRAYRYLMDNLDQKDLSVREVASHIGVTERAIQAAFKNHLGLSPSELIRRQRMERIRDDLLDDDTPVTRVLDVAHKWGVRHRSTLINGYRRVFEEAPSQTMGR